MDGDASTPPSRARLALAWRVGLRPRSPRLVPAAICVALAAGIPTGVDANVAAALRDAWSAREGHVLLDMVIGTWPMVVAGLVALALAAAAVTGALGWARGGRARLGRVGPVRSGVVEAIVGAAVAVAVVVAVRGVIAGAARGVDAGEAGLTVLWVEWLRRVLLAAGLVGLVGAAVEVASMRQALRRALYRTRAEVKEQSR